MMNGCDWAKVGVWDKRERNQQKAFVMLQRLGTAYSEICTTAGELDVVAGEVFRWVKSTSRGSGEIGFSQKREKGHQEQTPRAACAGMDKSKAALMRRSKVTVIGCFWRDFVPMTRLRPFLVRATGKLFRTSHGKP